MYLSQARARQGDFAESVQRFHFFNGIFLGRFQFSLLLCKRTVPIQALIPQQYIPEVRQLNLPIPQYIWKVPPARPVSTPPQGLKARSMVSGRFFRQERGIKMVHSEKWLFSYWAQVMYDIIIIINKLSLLFFLWEILGSGRRAFVRLRWVRR